jgi:hypothetical protein
LLGFEEQPDRRLSDLLVVDGEQMAFEEFVKFWAKPPTVYRNTWVGVDTRVVTFALAIGLAATQAMVVFLVWRTPRVEGQPLAGASPVRPRGRPLGPPMMAFQVAFAILLVHGAMIAVRSMVALLSTPLGFTSDHVVTLTVSPPGLATHGQPAFYRQLVRAIGARSDTVSGAAAAAIPLDDQSPDDVAHRADGSRTGAGIVSSQSFRATSKPSALCCDADASSSGMMPEIRRRWRS